MFYCLYSFKKVKQLSNNLDMFLCKYLKVSRVPTNLKIENRCISTDHIVSTELVSFKSFGCEASSY
jgi:hypothetical protein